MPDDIENPERGNGLFSKLGNKIKKLVGAPLEKRSVLTLDQIQSAGVAPDFILEEEQPENKKPEPPKAEVSMDTSQISSSVGEVDKEKIMFMFEKFNQQIDFIKDLKMKTDERIDKLSGELGELRAMFLQREKEVKDVILEYEKIKSVMEVLEPEKMTLKLQKIEKGSLEKDGRLEKNEAHINDIREKSEKVQRLLDKIGNFENIIKIHNLMNDKLSIMNEREKKVEVLSSKAENAYFEMEKRVNEIRDYVNTLEKLEDMSKDSLKEIDLLKIKMESFVDQREFDKKFTEFKSDIEEDMKRKINESLKPVSDNAELLKEWSYEQLQKLSSKLASKEDEKKDLEAKKEKIMWFLDEIEKQYKSNLINDKTFKDVRKKNLAEIERIDSLLNPEEIIIPFEDFNKPPEVKEEKKDKTNEENKLIGEQAKKITEQKKVKEPENPGVVQKAGQEQETPEPEEEKSHEGSKFIEIWEKLSEDKKFENLSKREKQLLSVLYSSEATEEKNSIPIKNLAKTIYRENYDHDKLSYISRLIGNLEKEGYVVKVSKGRESLIHLNLPKIEGKEEPTQDETKEEKPELEKLVEEKTEINGEEQKKSAEENSKPKEEPKQTETKELTGQETPKTEAQKEEKPEAKEEPEPEKPAELKKNPQENNLDEEITKEKVPVPT